MVEILVVLAIILAFAAIFFFASSSARGAARHTECKSQLRQIYQAAMLYAADHDTPPYEELGPLVYLPDADFQKTMQRYGAKNVWHCPSTPARAKSKIGNTYMVAFAGDDEIWSKANGEFSDMPSVRKENLRVWSLAGDDFPVVRCHIHDELEYIPKEGLRGAPWLIWVRAYGATKAGRAPWAGRFSLLSMVPR